MSSQPEVWLRGPLEGMPPPLMPAAHALLQTLEDVEGVIGDLTPEQVWRTPAGAASIGFHVTHLSGSIDRLLTYARGESLSAGQRAVLAAEKELEQVESTRLIAALRQTVEAALAQLRGTDQASLNEPRAVGRAALPTTVLGLLFHAAEHAQRHAGQVVTTKKFVTGHRPGGLTT